MFTSSSAEIMKTRSSGSWSMGRLATPIAPRPEGRTGQLIPTDVGTSNWPSTGTFTWPPTPTGGCCGVCGFLQLHIHMWRVRERLAGRSASGDGVERSVGHAANATVLAGLCAVVDPDTSLDDALGSG